jgi:predicted transcriptional regulator
MTDLNENERKVLNDICEAVSNFNGQWTETRMLNTNKYGDPQAFGAYMTILETKGLMEVNHNSGYNDQIELTDEGWEYFDSRS